MTATTATPKALAPDEGLRLQSGPGRDLVFKLTGDETRGAIDYFVCEVAPHGGPPLHLHHEQDEALHVVNGRFKVRMRDQEHTLEPGGFACLPAGLTHGFLNLTDQPAELIVYSSRAEATGSSRSSDLPPGPRSAIAKRSRRSSSDTE